jgi:hypothetical protein
MPAKRTQPRSKKGFPEKTEQRKEVTLTVVSENLRTKEESESFYLARYDDWANTTEHRQSAFDYLSFEPHFGQIG